MNDTSNHAPTEGLSERFDQLRSELASRLIGREDLIDRLVVALLTGGHVLIEGAPGLAKTRGVKLFAQCVATGFSRIQATPDLLPADLTGTNVFRPETGSFDFVQGPLFSNVVLVDEINRAPPKVQSALLEAMGEGQITVGGTTRTLSQPFMVAGTQNPLEHEGTYPLPEAQLDRFLFFIDIPMPDLDQEKHILDLALTEAGAPPSPKPILQEADIANAQTAINSVHASDAVRDYAARLTSATRGIGAGGSIGAAEQIEYPASPRATIGMVRAAQASAWLERRDHVLPTDISELAGDVLSGRISLNYRARAEGLTNRQAVEQIVAATPLV
jgi:MoxR-like ATPase